MNQQRAANTVIFQTASRFVIAVGLLVLVGWGFGVTILTSVVPGLVPMNPTTAMLFILGGVSLSLNPRSGPLSKPVSNTCASLIAAVGIVRLWAYATSSETRIDTLLFAHKLLTTSHGPNRMAPNTAFNFVLLGASLMTLSWVAKSRICQWLTRFFSLLSMLSSTVAVLGYINGIASLYGIASFIPMALHTAGAFLVLSMAMLFGMSDLDQTSSSLPARSLQSKITAGFAAAVFMLVVISVVAYQSIQQFISNARWEGHTRQVLLALTDVELQLKDVETRARGYLITGDQQYLQDYRIAADHILPELDQLRSLTSDNASQQHRLDQLDQLVKSKLAIVAATVEARRAEGFDAAQRRMASNDGRQAMGEIRTVLADMTGEENGLLKERSAAEESSASRTITLIYVGGGFAFLIVGIAGWKIRRDMLVRGKAEAALRQSEEKFRALVESAKEYAILMLDLDGYVRSWNPGATRIKGYEAHEIIGQHFSRFYPPEDVQRGKLEYELKTAIERGQFEEDGWRVRKDGSRFWANVLITCLRDERGRPIGFSKITRDLTERKRAEEQTRSFFTLSLDLLCIIGVDGYFKHLNPSWESTLGYSDIELRARPYMELIHPEDRAASLAVAQKLENGGSIVNFENRYRCKDGSYRWFTWNGAVSSDRTLIYAAARDITEQKRTETAIAEMNLTLQRGNSQLEAANRELESFSYSVSHDLRAPLRGIDGFSQALLEDYGDRLDENGKDYLHRVRAATQRMGQLIDDILNLSRITRSEMRLEPVDLSTLALAVIDELKRAQPNRSVEIQVAGSAVANGDPRLLRVVLDNLLGNAWKFTSKRADGKIEFGVQETGPQTTYYIRDNGAGFDMTYAHKLFGAFQRLHAAGDFSGTGIGLATVQRVIHRHGGRIWAESAVERGATFYFTLSSPTQTLAQAA